MATSEILENIKKTLNKPLEKERVVYLMVEIRKFIDKSEVGIEKWPELKYWCDWNVHTRLDQKFAKETLGKMEQFLIENPDSKSHHSLFTAEFITLEKLRYQLFNFLSSNDLPTNVADLPNWYDFESLMLENLRDCPLEKSEGLLREFCFTKLDHLPETDQYSIDWKMTFNGSMPNRSGSVLHFKD